VKSLFLLTIGVVAGFTLAHLYNKTPRGSRLFGELDGSLTNFRAALVDGYRARDAELRSDGES